MSDFCNKRTCAVLEMVRRVSILVSKIFCKFSCSLQRPLGVMVAKRTVYVHDETRILDLLEYSTALINAYPGRFNYGMAIW